MKDPERLKDFILDRVDLTEVMINYGVQFMFNPKAAQEVQFRCPFHGKDNKPSARLYKATRSCWCWVCHKKWDVINFIKDKEGLKYYQTLLYIINRYNLDTSEIPDEPRLDMGTVKEPNDESINMISLENRIKELRKKLPLEKYSGLVTAWMILSYTSFIGDKNLSKNIAAMDEKICRLK